MARTLAEIIDEAGTLVGRTDTVAQKVIRQSANRRYRQILQAEAWPELMREVSVTVAAGDAEVGVPFLADTVRSVFNTTTNEMLEPIDGVTMDRMLGNVVGQSGALRHWSHQGTRGAFKNLIAPTLPIEAFRPIVVSTQAVDNCTVSISGYDSEGLPYTMAGTINGTNEVLVDTYPLNLDGATVLNFSKDRDTIGTIQLKQTDTLVGEIGYSERAARYTWLRFPRAADVATTLRVQARIYAPDMTEDSDVPAIRGVEDMLVVGACADLWRYLREHQKALGEEGRFMEMKADFLYARNAEMPDVVQASGMMHHYRETGDL